MYISTLHLQHFRNYKTLNVRFSPILNIIYGDNGQGKTNLMESIYFLATGRSHRTTRDQELVTEGFTTLSAKTTMMRKTGELSLELQLGLQIRKQVKINGITEKKITNLIGNLAAVFFSPDDLQLIKGPPAGRRRFLDIELSQLSQTYLYYLMTYSKVLSQRNTILKQERVDHSLLAIYDEQLLTSGVQLILRRSEAIKRLSELAVKYHRLVSEGKEELCLQYVSQGIRQGEEGSLEQISEKLKGLMAGRRHEEIRRHMTIIGPHRDDLLFLINQRDARLYASQGQQRTAILSLKLAEIEFMHEALGEYPILLLDDVFSELDPGRRHYLLNAVKDGVQTFMSCTSLEDMMVRTWPVEHRLFHVQLGKITIDTRGLNGCLCM